MEKANDTNKNEEKKEKTEETKEISKNNVPEEKVVEEGKNEKTEKTENIKKEESVQETQKEKSEIKTETENKIEKEQTEKIDSEEKQENSNKENITIKAVGDKIYLTEEQEKNKTIEIKVDYETKIIKEETYYYKKIENNQEKYIISVEGYMPKVAELKVEEVSIENTQEKINKKSETEVKLETAYDIKIIVNETEYEPEEVGENVKVTISKPETNEEISNIWHIKDDEEIEKIEINNKNAEFTTNSFSVYGIELSTISDGNRITIDDTEADKYYYNGLNYTEDISGEKQDLYNDNNLVKVTVNYHGYKNGETNSNLIGYVSNTERESIFTYIKYYPVQDGKVTFECIDNPYMDRPAGYGFGGWILEDGTEPSLNSNTKVQSITANVTMIDGKPQDLEINVYANWKYATMIYLGGFDSENANGSRNYPYTTWETAIGALKERSSQPNNRELNIIILCGDVSGSFSKNNSNYNENTNIAFTLTSIYRTRDENNNEFPIDYRDNAVWSLGTNEHVFLYNDFQMDFVNMSAQGYEYGCQNELAVPNTNYPILTGNNYNLRIGRGMRASYGNTSNAANFQIVQGGPGNGSTTNAKVGSTSNDNHAYRMVVESGKYFGLYAYQSSGNDTATYEYYGKIDMTLGNDYDRIKGNNSNLNVYYRVSTNGSKGKNARINSQDEIYNIVIKSGKFGTDYFNTNSLISKGTPDNYKDRISWASGITIGGCVENGIIRRKYTETLEKEF